MSQVKQLAAGWLCVGCGRVWSPYYVACGPCAATAAVTPPEERQAFLERYGYRKRIKRMVATLEKVGV